MLIQLSLTLRRKNCPNLVSPKKICPTQALLLVAPITTIPTLINEHADDFCNRPCFLRTSKVNLQISVMKRRKCIPNPQCMLISRPPRTFNIMAQTTRCQRFFDPVPSQNLPPIPIFSPPHRRNMIMRLAHHGWTVASTVVVLLLTSIMLSRAL